MKYPQIVQLLFILVFASASAARAECGQDACVSADNKPQCVNTAGVAAGDKTLSEIEDAAVARNRIVVTYFFTNARCRSCLKIEELTRKALEKRFAAGLADGSIVFRAINIDEAANKHYIDGYELAFKTVVISDMRGDTEARWVRMDKVWELLRNPGAFESYIVEGVNAYLGPQG